MRQANPISKPVICFGELLWDNTPSGMYLGGAPLNVAYHLAQLGGDPLIVSATGADDLGNIARHRSEEAGIDVSNLQISPAYPTGLTNVQLDDDGDASYEIRKPAAWDQIECTQLLLERAAESVAVVYGTLGSRNTTSRNTLLSILDASPGIKVCDVNLRSPYDDLDLAALLVAKADILKINESELYALLREPPTSLNLPDAVQALMEKTSCRMIFVTRGSRSTVFTDGDRLLFITPPPHKRHPESDTIGAGDAFTAALLDGLLAHTNIETAIEQANRLASFVASRHGAQPKHDPELLPQLTA